MKNIELPICMGDGVGPELMEGTRQVLSSLGKKTGSRFREILCPAGSNCYIACGEALPRESIAIMKNSPAVLMTAISSKQCPPPSPMGQLRKELNIYADIRRCQSVSCAEKEKIDIVIFRECSEDFLPDRNMYCGVGECMPTEDVAISLRVTTRKKCAMISADAFAFAQKYGYKRVTVANKSVVFTMGCGMFKEEAAKQAAKHPDIAFDEEAPDGLAGNLVLNPENYGVIIAASLFGDILSDVAAAKVGNIMRITNSNGKNALFYPSHGPQNKYIGTGKVSPIVLLQSTCDLFDWIGETTLSHVLNLAIDQTVNQLRLNQLILPEGIKNKQVIESVVEQIERV